ncbi:MAG TPA: peptidoglycan-binding protein LysM [Thermoanaerobaculia bacterium]|jgi:nucleoid-associated protein YgaU|nr:peptidoglycan-binding protein LysM [Thermoanaerobaculia bacterium]
MGLIDFIKNVGHKLDHSQQSAPAAQHPQAHPQGPSAQDVAKLHEKQTETALANLVTKMGFNVQDLMIDVEGSKVTVKGKVNSQEEREKIVLLLGNSEGIGSVDDQLQVSNPQAEAQYYDVKAGDNLSKISKQFYGDANKYNAIFEANRPMLKNADDIYPGQKLRIPAMATAQA